MFQKIQKKSLKIKNIFFSVFLCGTLLTGLSYGYIDQIWMKSPSQIKTVFDVKVFALLRNLYVNQTFIDPEDITWQKSYLDQERAGLLEQTVVYQYIKDNRIPINVQKFEILNAFKKLAQVKDFEKNRKKIFPIWDIQQNDIDQWIEKRLMLEKFLQSHPPFQAIITDRKIEQYYLGHKDDRFLQKPLADIRDLVIQDYQKMHLQVEFKKWLDIEVRRQKWKVHD